MITASWPLFIALAELLFRLVVIALVLLRRRQGAMTQAWVVLILVAPVLGPLLYLLLGEIRLGSSRVRRHREIVQVIESSIPFNATTMAEALQPSVPEAFVPIARLAEAVSDNQPLGGNAMQLMGDTDLFIQSLIEDIDQANDHCHLLFYIFLPDHSGQRVADALMRAAARGVKCRVLVDAVGSKIFLRSELSRQMRSAGVQVVEALPVRAWRMPLARIDLRNHRKIVVIDGKIGYTGSHNLADAEFAIKPRFAPWVDATIRVQGPITWDLQVLFIEDWFLDTDECLTEVLQRLPGAHEDNVVAQVTGTGPNSYNEALRQLSQAAFHAAREELVLTTPYFVPDDATLTALCIAARRGVHTVLVVPARNDSPLVAAASRSNYQVLLQSGVEILEYEKGLLHAKTLTIDRNLAMLGTANIDRRSFELNFEVNVVVFDDDFASQLRFLQTEYINDSVPVDPDKWKRRAWPNRLVCTAAGLMSPLL